MSEETSDVRIARLEEQLRASDKALDLARSVVALAATNSHAIIAEIIAIVAAAIALYAVVRR